MARSKPALARTLLATCLVAAVAVACQRGVDEPTFVAEEQPVPEVRQVVTASILVTEAPTESSPTIDSITIRPESIALDRGESLDLSAEAFSADGRFLRDVEFVWSMVDPRAGTISKEGRLLPGVSPGEYEDALSVTAIQNTSGGIRFETAFASMTILGKARLPTLNELVIVPPNPTLLPEQIYRLRAVAFDEDGEMIPDVNLVWQVNDERLGRVDNIGYLSIKKGTEGTYDAAVSVTALWAGQSMTVTSHVNVVNTPEPDDFMKVHALPHRFNIDPGDRLELRAVALNGLGELIVGTELRWSMVNPDAGVIDGSGNFIAGAEPGVYTEAVRVEAVVPGEGGFIRAEDYASLVIRKPEETGPLARLSVEPHSVVTRPLGRATLFVRALDESGGPAENVAISWEVLKEGAGDVSEFGAFVAGPLPGTYKESLRVTASQRIGSDEITKSDTVDVVITGRLVKLGIIPAIAVVAADRTVHFNVVGRDQAGNALPTLVVLWSVTDRRVGTVDPFGNFTAGSVPGLYENALRAEVVQKLPHLK